MDLSDIFGEIRGPTTSLGDDIMAVGSPDVGPSWTRRLNTTATTRNIGSQLDSLRSRNLEANWEITRDRLAQYEAAAASMYPEIETVERDHLPLSPRRLSDAAASLTITERSSPPATVRESNSGSNQQGPSVERRAVLFAGRTRDSIRRQPRTRVDHPPPPFLWSDDHRSRTPRALAERAAHRNGNRPRRP
ncbi:hypothetical protein ACLMJK_001330 [Lecanora helva]